MNPSHAFLPDRVATLRAQCESRIRECRRIESVDYNTLDAHAAVGERRALTFVLEQLGYPVPLSDIAARASTASRSRP